MARRAVMVVVWLVGVLVAVTASVAAVGVVGDRVTSRQVPADEVAADDDAAAPSGEVVATEPPVGGAGDPVDGDAAPGAAPGPTASTASSGGPSAPGESGGAASAPTTTTGAAPRTDPAPTPAPVAESAPPTVAPAPTTAPPAVEEVYATGGGSVGVRCTASAASLLYATPGSGWAVHGTPSVSGPTLDVRFEQVDGDGEVRMRVTCVDGIPMEEIEER